MIIKFPTTKTAAAPARKLNALAVEAALNGRRTYDQLHPLEVSEVVRIARRRGDTLDQVTELLNVDFFMVAAEYDAAGA